MPQANVAKYTLFFRCNPSSGAVGKSKFYILLHSTVVTWPITQSHSIDLLTNVLPAVTVHVHTSNQCTPPHLVNLCQVWTSNRRR